MAPVLRVCALLAALAAGTSLAAASPVTEVVSTRQPAEQLLPVLQPLAGPGVTLQAFRGQLIMSGPSAQVDALKAILGQLDRPLQNLRISVRQAVDAIEGSGVDRVAVSDGRVTIGTQSSTAHANGQQVQQVTVLEGTPAWLSVDTEVPTLGIAPSGAVTSGYLPLGNGLELLPMIAGDRIRLQVRQRTARAGGDEIRTATIATVLLLQPGAWVPLGDVAASESGREDVSGLAAGDGHGTVARARDSERRHVVTGWEVRVELLEP